MAKRVDPLKAKAAKQKKMAIGLSVALVAVLAYQGPKTLKMLKGPQPVATAAAVEPPAGVPAPTTSPPPGSPAVLASDPSGTSSEPAVLANSDAPVAVGEGQLLSFEQFESKDPFRQQAEAPTVGDAPPEAVDGSDPTSPDDGSQPVTEPGSEPLAPGLDPSIPGSAENPPISTGGIGGSGSSGSGSPSVPFTPGPTAASATTISINGIEYTVTINTPFPAEQPTFEVVSFAKDGKSVQIGVAGGSLLGGGATVKLTVGKPLTLQNTADGSRYKLQLLTVEGAVSAASKG